MTQSTMTASQAMLFLLPAYGENWKDTTEILLSCPATVQRLGELERTLRRDGTYRDPIVWDVDEDLGKPRLCNGTHRLVAASWVPEARVVLQQGYGPSPTEYIAITLEADADLTDDDCLWSAINSFPLSDDLWVETDLMCQSTRRLEGCWYCPHAQVEVLLAGIVERAARFGVALKVVGFALWTAEDMDREDLEWPS